jgi:PAS domain S-box-containing protein
LAERALAEESARQRKLFEGAPGFITILRGPDHVFEFVNGAYARLFGGREFVGRPVREVFPELDGQGYFELLDQVYASGERFVAEQMPIWLENTPGHVEEAFLDFIYAPTFDESGNITGIFCEGHDVTRRARAEVAARETQDRLTAVFARAPAGIAEADVTGRLTMVNDRYCELVGRPREDLLSGRLRIQDLTYPADLERNLDLFERAVASGEPYEIEKRYVRPDGTTVWVNNAVSVLHDKSGRLVALLAVNTDLTERKRAEQHQQTLINELNHRVKNTLTMVQSIATRTLRAAATLDDARTAFEGRLIALSHAHDVLTRENWEGAGLHDIIALTVRAYSHRGEGRLKVSGPRIQLSPRAALGLAMGFQELATNAVKYGALSGETGEVRINWEVDSASPSRLHLRWEEKGGPAVTSPRGRGFGTHLLERFVATELDGKVHMEFAPGGLVCTMDALLDSIRPGRN